MALQCILVYFQRSSTRSLRVQLPRFRQMQTIWQSGSLIMRAYCMSVTLLYILKLLSIDSLSLHFQQPYTLLMQTLNLDTLQPHLHSMLLSKYSPIFQPLRHSLLHFHNLTHQILSLFHSLLPPQPTQPLDTVIHRTMAILNRLLLHEGGFVTEDMLISHSNVQQFIRVFVQNLNILCTYYHSLNHCEGVANSGRYKEEKRKIIEGINKMYVLHNRIRELYGKSEKELRGIEVQMGCVRRGVEMLVREREAVMKEMADMEARVRGELGEFWGVYGEVLGFRDGREVREARESKEAAKEAAMKRLMRGYFRLLSQYYQAQAQLQIFLGPLLAYCEQAKNKKKSSNYILIDAINVFTRITGQLLKGNNFTMKNLKKIRLEDLGKALHVLLEEVGKGEGGQWEGGLWGMLREERNQKSKEGKQGKQGKEGKEDKQTKQGKERRQGRQAKEAKQKKQPREQHPSDRHRSPPRQKQPKSKPKHPPTPQKPMTTPSRLQPIIDHILQSCTFLLQCMRQLEKVQSSQILTLIQEYREKMVSSYGHGHVQGGVVHGSSTQQIHNPNTNIQTQGNNTNNWKRLIALLCEYQHSIQGYYRLHESAKVFGAFVQEMCLGEFGAKVVVEFGLEGWGPGEGEAEGEDGREQQ